MDAFCVIAVLIASILSLDNTGTQTMKKLSSIFSFRKCIAFLGLYSVSCLPAYAVPTLFDWSFNLDGAVYNSLTFTPATLPAAIASGGFDFTTGLGTINISVSGSGAHHIGSFFDHEISLAFNEAGGTSGVPIAGQSWELDDPLNGDIVSNSNAGTLDNTNDVSNSPSDVSMAMAWDFTLAPNDQAVLTFLLSSTQPSSAFFLTQTDVDSGEQVFFSSAIAIPNVNHVPEPGTVLLIGAGLAGLLGMQGNKGRTR